MQCIFSRAVATTNENESDNKHKTTPTSTRAARETKRNKNQSNFRVGTVSVQCTMCLHAFRLVRISLIAIGAYIV